MIENLPERPKSVLVEPRPSVIVLAEDSILPLSLNLPPVETILEMRALRERHFSLNELVGLHREQRSRKYEAELANLERKRELLGDSPTMFARLANLAEYSGRPDKEKMYLLEGRTTANDSFFEHRIGAFLLTHGSTEDAEKVFSALDLKHDAMANLRLAYISVRKMDLRRAQDYVHQAIRIDPLSPSARMFEGAVELLGGHYETAIQSYRVALDERPTSSALQTNVGLAYLCLRHYDKALSNFRRAVALDPLNVNAVTILADTAFFARRNEDAVPALRYLIQFEQKSAGLWARLARALLELGQIRESIDALKRQGSIEETGGVWNNLGVAYSRAFDSKRALDAFSYAMSLEGGRKSRTYFLAGRNVSSTLLELGRIPELDRMTNRLLEEGGLREIVRDKELSDIVLLRAAALSANRQMSDAASWFEAILSMDSLAPALKVSIVAGLCAHYGITGTDFGRVVELIETYGDLFASGADADVQSERIEHLMNNAAFALAEAGHLIEAERLLNRISHRIHRSHYPTATLGLLHMKRGNVDRAVDLYEEAVGLATRNSDKRRIRQKLNFELGMHYLETDRPKARRFLAKAASEEDGAFELVERSKRVQEALQ